MDLSGLMDNYGTNKPAPGKVFDAGFKVNPSQTTEVKATVVTPEGIPVNMATSNTLNVTDQNNTNKTDVSVGINRSGTVQGKVYVSNSTTIKTDGIKDNKANVGLKAE